MRILGIDPGFATIGFGLVEADRGQVHMVTYGAITTPAGLPLSRRLYSPKTANGSGMGTSTRSTCPGTARRNAKDGFCRSS